MSYLTDLPTLHISLHSLVGNATTETLRVNGTIKNKEIVILVDGGSTHNFIQDGILSI